MLLNRLKATCPHCQHKFWQTKSVFGIRFCPQCLKALYIVNHHAPKLGKKTDKILNWRKFSINFLFIFIIIYTFFLQPSWELAGFTVDLVGLVIPMLMYMIAALLISLVVKFFIGITFPNFTTTGSKLLQGIDTYHEVRQDKGEYILTTHLGQTHKLSNCPICSSQRLQHINAYDHNMARYNSAYQSPLKSDEPNGKVLIGCLHCHTVFEIRDQLSRYTVWLELAFIFIVVMTFDYKVELLDLVHIPFLNQPYAESLLLVFILALLITVAEMLLTYLRNKGDNDLIKVFTVEMFDIEYNADTH